MSAPDCPSRRPPARRHAPCRAAALLAFALLVACDGGYRAPTGASPVGQITVTPDRAVVGVGESVVLEVSAVDTLGYPIHAGFLVSHSNRTAVRLVVESATAVRAYGVQPGLDFVTFSDPHLQGSAVATVRVVQEAPAP